MALGIRGQLFRGFGVVIALMSGVGIVGWYSTSQLNKVVEDLYVHDLQGTAALANADAALWNLRYGFPQFLVAPEKRGQIRTDEPKLYKVIQDNFDKYRKIEKSPELDANFKKLEEVYNQYIAARPRWFDLIEANKLQEAAAHRAATTTPLGAELVKLIGETIELQRKVGESEYQSAQAQQKFLITIQVLALLIALGVSVYMVYLLSNNITKPVLNSVNKIASSSNEIAATVDQQDRTITQQATSVNETTTTIEELGASSRQAAEQADASAASAKQALLVAESGLNSVEQTTTGLNTLKDSVGNIADQIMRLSEQTGQISGVTALVADIANQTNMLALNAAVEAARAGEQGKGFAVVASEIRKLADESKKSADRINQMVTDLQAAMNSTVMVTDEGSKTANTSIQLAQGTAAAFNEVTEAVNSVFLNNQQIALSAKQQAVAVQQVVSAMNAINLGAKETASGVMQVKSSADNLKTVADELRNMSQQIFSAA